MSDEPFDFGAWDEANRPKARAPRAPAPLPQSGVKYGRCVMKDRPLCEICHAKAEYVNGVPTHLIERAYYERVDKDGKRYFCAPCGNDMQTGEKNAARRTL